MTATTPTAAAGAASPPYQHRLSGGHPLAQAGALSRRAVLGIWRQPQTWMPSVLFPLLFAALNNAAFARVPGSLSATLGIHPFGPRDHYLEFLLVATVIQGVLFGSLSGASELAQDIESGFFDRLIATPVARWSILVGRLAGSAVLGLVQGLVFLGVFTLFGADVAGGAAAYVFIPVMAMLVALGIGGLLSAMAIRTGSVEAVQGSFPLIFITLFISSAFFPTALMKGWYRAVATHNPVSIMIDAMRHQVLYGWDTGEAAKGLAVALLLVSLAIGLCLVALRARLAKQ
jgi:ABC-2 type transport system permease protein